MTHLEIQIMERIQAAGGTGALPAVARVYSRWGDHAAGWILLGAAGAALSPRHRSDFARVTSAAVLAHAGAVVTKRLVRRRRPSDPRLKVLVKAPSDLSFPSAHAASTTGAAVALAPLVGAPLAAGAAVAMAGSRVLLGVHYPSDVIAGATLGATAGVVVRLARRAVQE